MSRVLVIDDEPAMRYTLEAVLGDSGLEVSTADGGAAGLAEFEAHGADVVLTDLAMPDVDGMKVLAQGHLALVNNQVDQASGTISMKATFQNKDNTLWPGLSVSTKLLVQTLHNAVVIPNDAIQHGPGGLYAFVVDSNNKAHMRPLKIGDQGDSQSIVLSGVSAGEKVIVAGQYRVEENTLVAERKPEPAKEAQDTTSKAQ